MWRIGGRFAVDLWRFGQPDGGMAGEVVHKNASKWGKWLASIPLLVGAEALVVGVHWLGGVALAESVWLAGMEVGLEIVVTMLLCIWKRK